MVTGLALADSAPDDIDWDNAPPSQVHQRLADGKANNMAEKNIARSLALSQPRDNNQPDYDVTMYDVAIRVNDTSEVIYGIVTMTAASTIDGLTQVEIDLQADMVVDSVKSSAGPRVYSRAGDLITAILNGSLDTGEQFDLTFYYHGHPTEGGFQGFTFDTHGGSPMISSLSEPYFARSWWPCKDRMDDKADSFNIAITVDTSMYVGSNGTLDSTVAHGDNTHTFFWSVRYPMVTYLFSVAIHDYSVWYDEWVYNNEQDTMPLVHAIYPDWLDYSYSHYDVTPYVLTVLSDQFGLYPYPEEKYGHANFEWGGGMEHQTMTSMGASSFGFSEPVVVHEATHQWWGDMITCESWSHIWLNEGWASYGEALYYEVKDGPAAYHSYMNSMAYSGGGTIYVYDTTAVWTIFHSGLSYDKGSWVCHMLRGVLGDEAFFDGIEAYYNSQYKFGAATTEEFRDVFELSSGVELDWFFEDWIYGTYRPYYRYRYFQEPSDTGGVDVYLRVEQTQTTTPQVFRTPIDFVFEFASAPDETVTLRPDERVKMFKLNFDETVTLFSCDPDDWVLKYAVSSSWRLYFITLNSDLSEGAQYIAYNDTLDARGGSGQFTYSIVAGTLPTGYSFDSDGVLSGTTLDTGTFVFTARVDDDMSSYFDEVEYSLHMAPSEAVPGDIDNNGAGPDITDLIYMVTYMFQGGPPPPIMNVLDMNNDCEQDIADLIHLVQYMFQGGPPPLVGCLE
jgi:aminopeptidase N